MHSEKKAIYIDLLYKVIEVELKIISKIHPKTFFLNIVLIYFFIKSQKIQSQL